MSSRAVGLKAISIEKTNNKSKVVITKTGKLKVSKRSWSLRWLVSNAE